MQTTSVSERFKSFTKLNKKREYGDGVRAKWLRLNLKSKLRPFLIVGAVNTVIGLSIFLILAEVLIPEVDVLLVFILATTIAVLLGYVLQRRFVWLSKVAVRRELPKYLIVSFLQGSLNYLSLMLFVKKYHYELIPVQLITTATLVTVVFFAHGNWTFKSTI